MRKKKKQPNIHGGHVGLCEKKPPGRFRRIIIYTSDKKRFIAYDKLTILNPNEVS